MNTTDSYLEYKLLVPLQIEWNPQPDITAYELAQLLPIFLSGAIMPGMLPEDENLLKHLIIKDPNKQDK